MRNAGRCLVIWIMSLGLLHASDTAAVVISGTLTGKHGHPHLALNTSKNEYLVVWGDRSSNKLYARIMSATGTLVTPAKQLGTVLSGSHYAVAYNSRADEYLVVWETPGDGTAAVDLYAQRVGADGKVAGDAVKLAGDTKKLNWMPDVIYNPTKDVYAVVWSKEGLLTADGGVHSTSTDGLYLLFLDGDGLPIGSESRIAGMNYEMKNGYLWHLGFQGFHIRWQSFNKHYAILANHIISTAEGRNQQIDFFYLKSDGTVSGTHAKVNTIAVGDRSSITSLVENTKNHQWLPVWEHVQKMTVVEGAIFSRLLNSSGGSATPKQAFVFANAQISAAPAAAFDPDQGRYFVVFYADSDPGNKIRYEVYGQAVASDGTATGKLITIASTSSDEGDPDILYNPVTKNYLVVYSQVVSNTSHKVLGTFVRP